MNLLELRVFWGKVLLRVEHVKYPWRLTIGQGRGVQVFIASDDLPSESYALVRCEGEQCVLAVAPGMTGEIERSNGVQPLTGTDYVLEVSDRSIVCCGGLTFALRFVPAESAAPRFAWRDVDHQFLQPLAMSLFGHIAAVVTLLLMPYATDSLREDFRTIEHIVELMPKPRVDVPRPPLVARNDSRTPKRTDHLVPTPSHRASPSYASVNRSDSIVDRFNDVLRKTSLDGRGRLGQSLIDLIGARGQHRETGFMGLGPRGTVGDIGGPAVSSRDVGPLTIGPRELVPADKGQLGSRIEHSPITPQAPSIVDALPREVIRAVVDRNREQIRYCYERELQKHQDLEGRVVIRWIVAATGLVVRVEVVESTVASREVGDCLTSHITRWRFPEPAGGGVVTVSYPFVFRAN